MAQFRRTAASLAPFVVLSACKAPVRDTAARPTPTTKTAVTGAGTEIVNTVTPLFAAEDVRRFREAGTVATLNADAYHDEITALDRLFFENKPLGKERRTVLVTKLEELAARVKAASDERFIEIETEELRRLAEKVKTYPGDSARARLTDDRMRIRSNLFDDRAWFARSAADL